MQNDCLLLKPAFECAEWKLSSASVVYLAFFSEEKRHDGLERAASDLLIHMHKLVRAALQQLAGCAGALALVRKIHQDSVRNLVLTKGGGGNSTPCSHHLCQSSRTEVRGHSWGLRAGSPPTAGRCFLAHVCFSFVEHEHFSELV